MCRVAVSSEDGYMIRQGTFQYVGWERTAMRLYENVENEGFQLSKSEHWSRCRKWRRISTTMIREQVNMRMWLAIQSLCICSFRSIT